MFGLGQGVRVTLGETPPQPHRGTLTPFIPLSLRAFKGEGEIRTEGDVGASAPTSPSSSVLGGKGDGFPIGVGNDGRGAGRPTPDSSRGIGMTREKGDPPQPHRGTLTPLVPLSLRAFKGEGEIRIEAHVRALHARGPLIQYW